MAWPPPLPPNTRTNTTGQNTSHPSDHNLIADALTELVARCDGAVTYTTPTSFLNGWNGVGGVMPPGYRKFAGNLVHLRGYLGSGTLNQPAFVLPAGFRPVSTQEVIVLANNAGTLLAARLQVDSAGNVRPGVLSGGPATVSWVSFSTIFAAGV